MTGDWGYEPPPDEPDEPLPLLPYAGTSGWSGTDTSRDRALREDADGTTSERQRRALIELGYVGSAGLTWHELARRTEWHHGQASGVLSVLHKEGRIVRLVEKRDRCHVYVIPAHQNGREADAYLPRASTEDQALALAKEALLAALELIEERAG